MRNFIKITLSDLQCNIYYFVIITSSVLIYLVLLLDGHFPLVKMDSIVASIIIFPTIVLASSPLIINRYKVIKKLLEGSVVTDISGNNYRYHIGIFMIRCELIVNGNTIEIILAKNKKNTEILKLDCLHLICDKFKNEYLIVEVYT